MNKITYLQIQLFSSLPPDSTRIQQVLRDIERTVQNTHLNADIHSPVSLLAVLLKLQYAEA